MDGLLIDSEVLWHEAEIEILGGLGVPLDPTGCRTTKGMFVDEVTAHWHGHYPWEGPPPEQVAVEIVDRVIELVVRQGRAQARCRPRHRPLCRRGAGPWRWRRRRSTG